MDFSKQPLLKRCWLQTSQPTCIKTTLLPFLIHLVLGLWYSTLPDTLILSYILLNIYTFKMKYTAVVALALAVLSHAQNNANLNIPDCARPCLDSTILPCGDTDYACICKDWALIHSSPTMSFCVHSKCVNLGNVVSRTTPLVCIQSTRTEANLIHRWGCHCCSLQKCSGATADMIAHHQHWQ